ncbi:MAG: YebC/PmpR family DNA-binding transcriptional regulator [Deltaproteobacteria bacterium]|nr:YebC/PmpR family DNA-binding transcriptional regulator [Deltaproteobacteria bacterium]
MSGHSRWSTIKHKKAAADAKRSKNWTKLIKEVTVAAKIGGGDPAGNPRLRTAIDKARAENMPNDTITRAIKKGTGDLEGVQYEEITYEGRGPGGTAVLVEVMTDNRNRTVSEIRHVFDKANGVFGEKVAWIFKKQGLITIEKSAVAEDKLMEIGLECGAEDVRDGDDVWEVVTDPKSFEEVKAGLEKAGLKPTSAELTQVPSSYVKLEGAAAESMLKFMTTLEDHDDIQNVYANFDIDAELMEKLTA